MTVVRMADARARLARSVKGAPMTGSAALVLAAAGALLIVGLVMILSASSVSAYERYGSSWVFFLRQLMWATIGIVLMLVAMRIDYRRYRWIGYALLVISFVGLAAVLHPAIGVTAGGSSRWIGFGSLRFQPSELAKLALVLVGADLCARKADRLRTMKDVMLPFGLIGAAFGVLVMAQPDLGTTLILGGIVMAVLYAGGARMRVLATLGGGATAAAAALAMSEGYRRARILSFRDPFADPLNTGYQAVQSQIALGSGGLFGLGLGAGRSKWQYVPNAHTDFIYAIIGEELGLVGTFAVLGLFIVLAYGGIRIARRAPDRFSRTVAASITAWIVGQAVINMGAVTGLLPITGVPLPLVSFGGSSLVFTLAAIGILANIGGREVWPPPVREEAPAPALQLDVREPRRGA